VAKVDATQYPDLALKYEVTSFPKIKVRDEGGIFLIYGEYEVC
jgi:hypothetical protein